MIKVKKSIDTLPNILKEKSTQSKHKRLLTAQKWLSSSSYKSPYQNKKLKESLKSIYNHKCAYCEQKMVFPKENQNKSASNDLTLEHYRPKSTYYWLAYSWDNLLPVCYDCNHAKEDFFDIEGVEITEIRTNEIDNIHELASIYNSEEKPKFIHPELENLSTEFIFGKDGTVTSNNERCQYVIEKCDLKRLKLVLKRRKIIDDLKSKYQAIQTEEEFYQLAKDIKTKSINPKTEFIALYDFILANFNTIITG